MEPTCWWTLYTVALLSVVCLLMLLATVSRERYKSELVPSGMTMSEFVRALVPTTAPPPSERLRAGSPLCRQDPWPFETGDYASDATGCPLGWTPKYGEDWGGDDFGQLVDCVAP